MAEKKPRRISRRKFLTLAGSTAAAAIVAPNALAAEGSVQSLTSMLRAGTRGAPRMIAAAPTGQII